MKRPFGASILSVLLFFLAVAGFGNGYLMLADPKYGTPILGVIALTYGATALAASVGLWRRRQWAYRAFLSWATVVVLMLFVMQFSALPIAWPQWLAFVLFVGGLLWVLARYVRRVSFAAL